MPRHRSVHRITWLRSQQTNHLTYGVEGLDYPVFHESGTDRLPARPVFDLLAEDEDLSSEVKEALSEHINQKLSEAQIARQ